MGYGPVRISSVGSAAVVCLTDVCDGKSVSRTLCEIFYSFLFLNNAVEEGLVAFSLYILTVFFLTVIVSL